MPTTHSGEMRCGSKGFPDEGGKPLKFLQCRACNSFRGCPTNHIRQEIQTLVFEWRSRRAYSAAFVLFNPCPYCGFGKAPVLLH